MSDRELIEVGLSDDRWADDARWAVYGQWDLVEIAEEGSRVLREQVLNGAITVQDLRDGVKWANALDREAVELYGSDLTSGGQQQERVARRLMHMTGRAALHNLRNQRLRTVATATRTATRQLFGMGKLETHDIDDRNLVQYMMKEGK